MDFSFSRSHLKPRLRNQPHFSLQRHLRRSVLLLLHPRASGFLQIIPVVLDSLLYLARVFGTSFMNCIVDFDDQNCEVGIGLEKLKQLPLSSSIFLFSGNS